MLKVSWKWLKMTKQTKQITTKKKQYRLFDKFQNRYVKLTKWDYTNILSNPLLLNRYSKIK